MARILASILLGCIILSNCQSGETQPGFKDLSQELPMREIYRLTSGELLNLAWFDEQTMLMDIHEGEYPRIEALNIETRALKSIRVESTCKRPFTRSLQILPNKRAGFLLDCPNISQIIHEIDLTNGAAKDFYVEPSINWVANFSYSYNMSELVLVDNRGLYMDSSLVLIDSRGERTNITPDFQRADFPVWSPTKDVIAFLGTKPYTGSDDPKRNWGQIEYLLDYPWKFYLYYPSNKETMELPLEIVKPNIFNWSPDGKMLAFVGEYAGAPGIWIVSNLDTPDKLSVTRVVDGIAVFDFSRNGKSIAFAYVGLQNTEMQNTIYVIDLPEEFTNP